MHVYLCKTGIIINMFWLSIYLEKKNTKPENLLRKKKRDNI